MGPNERRQKIIELLCLRRRETMGNLAHEFGVSRRTILLDIEVLSCAYPIITMRGKYGGGIKIMVSRPGCSVVKWTGGFVGRSRTRMSGGRGE